MNEEFEENSEIELTADEEALLHEMPELADVGLSRRKFLKQTIAGSLGLFALELHQVFGQQRLPLGNLQPPPLDLDNQLIGFSKTFKAAIIQIGFQVLFRRRHLALGLLHLLANRGDHRFRKT